MFQLFFAYFPIALLVYLMTKKNSMPSFRALPLSAMVLYAITLIVFQRHPNQVHAAVLDGVLVAFTPILIIAGAIFLFRTMEATGALSTIRQWLNSVSSNPVAQLMIVGWAFQFLIEGASGFGTPAALAGPVLVGLGFPAVRVAIFCLILNSVPVSFGAVGTPIWFGLSVVSLSDADITAIAVKTAWLNGIAAPFIVVIALAFVVDRQQIIRNFVFILLAVVCCVAPYVATAYLSYEFPALLGGGVGLVLTILLAKLGIGLEHHHKAESLHPEPVSIPALLKATFPLWGTVVLLIITRVPQLGIKSLLLLKEPSLTLALGSLGDLSISASLVVTLSHIFTTAESWSHSILYVPSLLPFGAIALLSLAWYRNAAMGDVVAGTVAQMRKPVVALFGALVFVNLMMMGGDGSAVTLIGKNLAQLTGSNWQFFAAFLGALGSFFSGSATISNLTFGGIQDSIAQQLALDNTTLLALQSVGGAMGNMVCINNIVAVASVLALGDKEGFIIKRTVIAVLVYGAIVGIASVILFA